MYFYLFDILLNDTILDLFNIQQKGKIYDEVSCSGSLKYYNTL